MEGSSDGNIGNLSPGDSAGVKDVANVVVKSRCRKISRISNQFQNFEF